MKKYEQWCSGYGRCLQPTIDAHLVIIACRAHMCSDELRMKVESENGIYLGVEFSFEWHSKKMYEIDSCITATLPANGL